jgi:L-ascorbate metabolism protein UlaG (beta-lactamase superfamily)
MNSVCRTTIAVLVLILAGVGVVGCGALQAPEQVAAGPTATTPPTQAPTATPIPPSPTPGPTDTAAPTATSIPPTPMPAPVGHAPVIVNLEDQSISDLERFPRLKLVEYVIDEDHDADDINWQVSGNEQLELRTIGSNLIVSLPLPDWTGSEALRFEACDPDGLCDVKDIVFTVREENDAPVVSVGGQIIMSGETFADIVLDDFVHDEENAADELTWNVSNHVDLGVAVHDRVATIELPGASWQGKEVIRFEACDPEGVCSSKDATFWLMDRSDVRAEITYIGNAGFMIAVGDKKILIDALVQEPALPREVAEPLLAASPPFDDVDLILATHSHFDHFSAEKVRSHLENNAEAVFVSARDAANSVDQIADVQDRIIPIQLQQRAGEKTQLVVNGIGLECIYLSHGGDILNLGFIITAEGRRFFHTGDMDPDSVPVSELQSHGLPDKQIDVAFVPHFVLITEDQHAHVTEGIQAKYTVPMHYQFTYPRPDYDLMGSYFPDAIVFHETMESWAMPD